MAHVYRIIAPSGSLYVGMTMGTMEERWAGHLRLLKRSAHHCVGLQYAAQKYGVENLSLELLEVFPAGTKPELVLAAERKWWNRYREEGINLYNGEPSGFGSVVHPQETRERISRSLRDRSKEKLVFSAHENLIRDWSADPSKSRNELCEQLGITLGQLRGILRKESISFVQKKRGIGHKSGKRLNLNDYPIASWYFEEGFSSWKIAEKIGCSQPIVLPVIHADPRYSPGNERKKHKHTRV